MKSFNAVLGVGLVAMSFAATAAPGLSYNYVQASYVSLSPDNTPYDKITGFNVGISGLIGEGVFVFGNYSDADTDDFTVGTPPLSATGVIAFKQYKAGLGLRGPLAMTPATDINFTAAFLRQEQKGEKGFAGSGADVDGNGYELGAGVRHLFMPQFEVGLGAEYDNVSNTGTHHTTGVANALFHVTPMFSVVGGYSYNKHTDGWAAGARINF